MPLPAGVDGVTVSSGKPLTLPDGTPIEGKLLFSGPDVAIVAGQEVFLGGTTEAKLVNGAFSVTLAANDVAGMSPSGWTYRVTAAFTNAPGWVRYISLPKASPSVTLADVIVPDPVAGQFNTLVDPSTLLPLSGGTVTGDLTVQGYTVFAGAQANGDYTVFGKLAAKGNAGFNGATPVGRQSVSGSRSDGSALASFLSAVASTGLITDSSSAGIAAPWRLRHLPDQATADSVYTGTAPTISTAQTTTPTAGYIKYAPSGVALAGSDVTGPFTYAGAGGFQIGTVSPDTNYVLPTSKYPNTYSSGQGVWSLEFGTDAQIIQLRFKYISSATMYRLSIDGRKYTDLMQSSGGTTAGSGHMLTVDFGSATPRRIRFDFYTMPFGGIYIPPTASLWGVPLQGGRFMVLGDSISDGSNFNTGAGAGTWVARAGRLLGSTDVWEQGRGGTGYITAGSYATFGDRVNTDVIAWNPSRLVVWGGYNDNTGSQSAISTAAASLYSTIKSGLPGCEVYVLGCWSPSGSPAASITNTDATLRTAAASAGFPFISPLTGAMYDSSGALVATHGAWITSANAAGYVNSSDNVHPTDAGHVYLSRRITAAIRQLMPA